MGKDVPPGEYVVFDVCLRGRDFYFGWFRAPDGKTRALALREGEYFRVRELLQAGAKAVKVTRP